MQIPFISILFPILDLQAAIRHSMSNQLCDNSVNLTDSKSTIHKATILLPYNFILLGHHFILLLYKIILLGHNITLFSHKLIFLGHKILLISHQLILLDTKIFLFSHQQILLDNKLILLGTKIVLLGHQFLQCKIIPDFIGQKSFLITECIPLSQNHPVLILHRPFPVHVNDLK